MFLGHLRFSGLYKTLEFVTAPKEPRLPLDEGREKHSFPRPTPRPGLESLREMGVAVGGSGYLGPPERLFFVSLELGSWGRAGSSSGDTWW